MSKTIKAQNIAGRYDTEQGHHADVTPGKSIRLHGIDHNRVAGSVEYDVTFKVGDTVCRDRFNLIYLGTIVSIGRKTVTVESRGEQRSRLDLALFSRRNRHFDLAKAQAHNDAESMCI